MIQTQHAVLPTSTHDEFAREEFCGTMRRFFSETLWPGNDDVYKGKQLPAFQRRHGRSPASRQEAQEAMEQTFYYRASNLFGRVAQEILWDTVGESIERQLPDLIEKAKPRAGAKGSVRLNPDMPMPKYIEAVDIHVMPGNFQTELTKDDVYQGALYDRGVHFFGYGSAGPEVDKLGAAMAAYVKEQFPHLKPRRILDVGCGVGFSTLPWKAAFPDAEVYGIDVGAPMIRYAHTRAESLGKEIHFSQQNAVDTDFEDGFFDIVTSCLVTHECPVSVNKAAFREAHRILASGGMMLVDGGARPKLDPERELFNSWFTNNVNEPFATGMVQHLTFPESFIESGFKPDHTFGSGRRPAVYMQTMFEEDKKSTSGGVSYAGAFKE